MPAALMVYDGDCSFCRRWIARWRNVTGQAIEYEPYQQAAGRFPHIPPEAFGRAVHLIEPDGSIYTGAEAVFRALDLAGRKRWLLWAYENIPGISDVCRIFYTLIARHRGAADVIDRWLLGRQTAPTTYFLTRQLFLRLLGVVFLVAFISLWVQIDGLIGSNGIVPASRWLPLVQQRLGNSAYWQFPTLCWFSSSDNALHTLCGTGVALSCLLIAGIAPAITLFGLWAIYLSLTVASNLFLGFQWDALLLESSLAAIFLAPWQLLPRWRAQPPVSMMGLWLQRWLLFRVMFLSGLFKLTAGDPNWLNWTALKYHYQTQPLPTWTSWYVHQLPEWFQRTSVGAMFFAELLVPLLIFAPRRPRMLGFWMIIAFQLLIVATGNYGFFNMLTIVLCFTLPEDELWRKLVRRKTALPDVQVLTSRWRRWPVWITAPVLAVILTITGMQTIAAFGSAIQWPSGIVRFEQWLAPLRSTNSYGLFRVMTTQRLEIIVEGSNDRVTWKEYEFKWKPGDVDRRPAFVTPHMPRLDWQMWFAALGSYESNPWFINFLQRVLEGSPQVLELMEHNPFPNRPPRYIRAALYRYEFTTISERRATGAWWKREHLGPYCPVLARPAPFEF